MPGNHSRTRHSHAAVFDDSNLRCYSFVESAGGVDSAPGEAAHRRSRNDQFAQICALAREAIDIGAERGGSGAVELVSCILTGTRGGLHTLERAQPILFPHWCRLLLNALPLIASASRIAATGDLLPWVPPHSPEPLSIARESVRGVSFDSVSRTALMRQRSRFLRRVLSACR